MVPLKKVPSYAFMSVSVRYKDKEQQNGTLMNERFFSVFSSPSGLIDEVPTYLPTYHVREIVYALLPLEDTLVTLKDFP